MSKFTRQSQRAQRLFAAVEPVGEGGPVRNNNIVNGGSWSLGGFPVGLLPRRRAAVVVVARQARVLDERSGLASETWPRWPK